MGAVVKIWLEYLISIFTKGCRIVHWYKIAEKCVMYCIYFITLHYIALHWVKLHCITLI